MHWMLILLPLSTWIAITHAFYPFFPDYLKGHVEGSEKRAIEAKDASNNGATVSKGFVTFKLSSKISSRHEPRLSKSSRIAHNLAKKYGSELPPQTVPQDSSLLSRENKYDVVKAAEPTQRNSAGIDQDGTDFSYFIQAELGSKATPIYMLLDTGATTTWVMRSGCTSSACKMHNSFGSEDSTTLEDTHKTFSVEYGSGSVSGHTVSDSMKIAGMKVTMDFGLANVTSDDFTRFPFDGILGMSRNGSGPQGFLAALDKANLISSNVFGVSLSRNSDGANDGVISFGAPDPFKYTGDISYTVVASVNSSNWAVPLEGVTIDGKSAVSSKVAYIDTGTTYVFGPPEEVEALYKMIPDSSSSDGVTWTIPCDSRATVAFTFSGKSYTVSSKDFMSPSGPENRCTCNVYGLEVVAGAWLLGAMFLKNVYTVFDVDQTRIGFASKSFIMATTSISATTTLSLTGTGTPISGSESTLVTITSGGTTTTAIAVGLGGHETATGSTSTATAAAESTPAATAAGMQSPGERLNIGGTHVLVACILSIIAVIT